MEQKIQEKNQQVAIYLGQKINSSQDLQKIFEETLWLTYRKGFTPLLKDFPTKIKYTSDQGWGCMLRVGQNLVAQALKQHYQGTVSIHDILQLFQDQEESPFSIHNIAKIAYEKFDMQPGEWYPPNRIMVILSQIWEKQQQQQFIIGQETLCIFSKNSDMPIIFEEIFYKVFQSKEQNLQIEEDSIEFYDIQQQILNKWKKQELSQKDFKRSLLLTINSRLGLEDTKETYQNQVLEIMNFKLFQGIIGGNMGSAHYFLGVNQDSNLIYLDPHTTQKASTSSNFTDYENITSFYCKKMKQLPVKQLNSSLGISFYINNFEDLQLFYKFINDMQKKYEKDFIWYFCDETPKYMKKQYQEEQQLKLQKNQNNNMDEDDDDDFIIIN